MQAREVRDMSDDELTAKERELKESLFFLRLRHGTNQLDRPTQLAQTRRDIARVKTVQRQRQLERKA